MILHIEIDDKRHFKVVKVAKILILNGTKTIFHLQLPIIESPGSLELQQNGT